MTRLIQRTLILSFAFLVLSCSPSGKKAGGEEFKIAISSEPATLNPVIAADVPARDVHGYVMDTLLSRNPDTYEFIPALAKEWSVSDDGLRFRFVLRDDATFHDGKPVTVEDVKFSFDVIFDDKFKTAPRRPYYEAFSGVEILDKNTVEFVAKEKYFGNLESAAVLDIVPKHVYGDPEKTSKLNKTVIGSGPYKLTKYDQGKRIVLEKNANWWGRKDPLYKNEYNFERIAMKWANEASVEVQMLEKGDLDFVILTPESYQERTKSDAWKKDLRKVKVSNQQPRGYGFIGWNLRNPKFKEKQVRIALAHLMNRKLMNEKFRFGMSLPATGPWYQQSVYASTKVKPFEYDPQKALKMLRDAGWADTDKDGILDKTIDGKKVQLSFTINNPSKDFEKYLTMYKEDAKKMGVDVNITFVEWNNFVKLLDEQKFEAVTLAWSPSSVDNDPKQIWHTSSQNNSGSNFIGYSNPKVDALIEKARGTLDREERIPILQEIYELIAADAPYLFMFNNQYTLYGHESNLVKPKDTFNYEIGLSHWSYQPL